MFERLGTRSQRTGENEDMNNGRGEREWEAHLTGERRKKGESTGLLKASLRSHRPLKNLSQTE